MSRNVPRQPQSEKQKAEGQRLWAASLKKAEQLAESGQQKPVVWRSEGENSDDLGL